MTLPSRVDTRPGAARSTAGDATTGSSIRMVLAVGLVIGSSLGCGRCQAASGRVRAGNIDDLGRSSWAEPHAREGVDDVHESAGRSACDDGKHIFGAARGGVHL